MVDVIFNDTNTLAIVSGSKSEKSARAKVHKLLKENPDYRNGWSLWFLTYDKHAGTYSYDIKNGYRDIIQQLETAIEHTKEAARREH